MTIIYAIIALTVLLIFFKGPSKRGKWEQEQLFCGLQDFLRWQLDLCFITFAARDIADFSVDNDGSKIFLKKCTDQVINDIISKRLSSEFITYYVIGAALKGAYILGGPSDMGARILSSVTLRRLLGSNLAQDIYDCQNGYSIQQNTCIAGAANFTEFYKWKTTGVQNKNFSAGTIFDYFIETQQEYMLQVMNANV